MALMGAKGEQMGSRMLICPCRTPRLAIERNGIICFGLQRPAYPVRQGTLDLFRIQTRQEFAIERIAGAEIAMWSQ